MTTRTENPKAKNCSTPEAKNCSTPASSPDFFDDWAHSLLVAAGALIVLLVCTLTVVFHKYRKRERSGQNANLTVELRPVSPTLRPDSPIFCEADTFQFAPSKDLEHKSETSEIVETEVDMSPTDVEGSSDDEYCYPDLADDKYEIMHPADPLEASGEYARTYDCTNINTGYMNSEDGYEVPHDYVYPLNTSVLRDSCFKEASELANPSDKENVDGNHYENAEILTQESLENETDT